MLIEIMGALVVRGQATDKVYLETNIPEAVAPFRGQLSFCFECAEGSAERYLRTYFHGIPVEVVGIGSWTAK